MQSRFVPSPTDYIETFTIMNNSGDRKKEGGGERRGEEEKEKGRKSERAKSIASLPH